jgi:hypothetical protein
MIKVFVLNLDWYLDDTRLDVDRFGALQCVWTLCTMKGFQERHKGGASYTKKLSFSD